MLSSAVFSFLACFVFASGVLAHGYDWVDTLPKCWQSCLKATSDGCDSKSCICDASQSDSYLPSAASSILANCDVKDWVLDSTFLFPVQAYCEAVGNPVPEAILSSAYAATATTSSTPPFTTRKVEHSQKSHSYETTRAVDDIKSTFTTTNTQTTTDKDGNTLEIIIPIIIGPKTWSTGKIVTSTLEAKATDSPSSGAASPSVTAAPLPTQGQQVASSTTSSQQAQRTSNSNGSPFENMQAGAGQWSVPGVEIGMGLLAGLFMRL
ncbi:hypothetical protein K505DRAFT_417804 [Melanomma pulvis-pyrius CBS 109.77]|uniref:Extracellular membrane protein CFEM domain-containing protein n=1 Tax=Melanomma pulvis-pyrius CBS 109.77 TaxID=1314802 RepID=A0A6A6XCJ6_9PLEO|nr:hypothetical protein K505DRAFT_417804 [Melanomma pulvis-pyrius CBS 109.77]